MKRQRLLAGLALAAASAMLVTGCTSASGDKAGGSGEVVLRLSSGYSSLDYLPAVAYFVNRVGELSGGALRIDVVHDRGKNTEPEFEQEIVGDVVAGKADLAWVGTRVFDTFGVKSFQALTAPMLVDSYPLLQAVLDSEVPAEMLKGLDALGVTGLGVVGDSLRKPLAADGPLLGPVDWQGITFAVIRSEGQAAAIRALGATPTDAWGTPLLDDGLASGEIQGFEKGLFAVLKYNSLAHAAPYVTANVTLWPQTIALVANSDRLSRLTEDERVWLAQAARDAEASSTSLLEDEDQVVADLCDQGARFANASESDLAALRQSFAPVYSELERDPQTKAFIDRIQQLKAATTPGPALSIPPGCTGPAPHGVAGDPLAGRWQTEKLTESEYVQAFVAAGGSEKVGHEGFSQGGISYVVITLQFEDGQFTEFESDDGGTPGVGYNARYVIGADDTFTLSGCGTYRFELSGTTLRLYVIDQCTNGDGPYNTTLFASFPMTRSG
jgi:TRAP-type transport system periplasmic protein